MSISKTSVPLIPRGTSVTAGATTKGAPAYVTPAAYDNHNNGTSDIIYRIVNGSSAPTVPLMLVIQVSDDGTNWSDYFQISGDIAAYVASTQAGVTSGSITLTRGHMYVRALAYGNQTNPVTVEVILEAVAG